MSRLISAQPAADLLVVAAGEVAKWAGQTDQGSAIALLIPILSSVTCMSNYQHNSFTEFC